MSTYLRLMCLTMIVAMGCRRTDPYFCENAPHHNCLAIVDASPDTPNGCSANSDCAAPTAVCDVPTRACVQCTASDHGGCTGNLPVCGDDHSCRGCASHADCPASLACLPDGSCGTDDNVAYVDPTATDNDVCTHSMPCTVVAKALAKNKPFIKFQGATGMTDEAVTVNGGRAVTFLADPGARLTRTKGSGPIVTVQDDVTSLSIFDLTISDAPNNLSSGFGCLIPTGGGMPTLALTRVTIANCPAGGISVASGMVTISGSTIKDNGGTGIQASGSTTISSSTISGNQGVGVQTSGRATVSGSTISGNQGIGISIATSSSPVTVAQSTILGNQGIGISATNTAIAIGRSTVIGNRAGGVSVSGGTFDIANNIIADNGDATSSGSDFGGLSVSGNGGDKLEFNTIAYNHAKVGTLLSAGVACSVTDFTAPNNIVTANNEGLGLPVQTKGVCMFGNSYTMPDTGANVLGFRSIMAPLDLHLTAASPASVVNAAGSCTGTDIDGDVRPVGGACDLGADERTP